MSYFIDPDRRGKPEVMVIGPGHKRWDLIFVARYPTAGA